MEITEVNPDKIYCFKYSKPDVVKKDLLNIDPKLIISQSDTNPGVDFRIFNKRNLSKHFHNFLLSSCNEILKAEQVQETTLFITDCWLTIAQGDGKVRLDKETMQHHWHSNSVLSGVYYVDVQLPHNRIGFVRPYDGMGPQLLCTESTNVHSDDIFGFQEQILFVETGELLLFNSRIKHGVPKFEGGPEGTRISLAFNTWCDIMGDSYYLSRVETVERNKYDFS